jgi:hypothetical protein
MKEHVIKAVWLEVSEQWDANPRLRLAIWAVGALMWVYGLLVVSDSAPALQAQRSLAHDDLQRIRQIESPEVWVQRQKETAQHWEALRALCWQANSPALAGAEAQDWLRALAQKAQLQVQDLRLLSGDGVGSAGGPELIRVRVNAAFAPLPLAALLNEIGQAERGAVVERLQIKTWTQPPTVDLELRIRLRLPEGKR